MIEKIVERLHVPPCLNDQVSGQDTANIIDIFWWEFKHWQNMTVYYADCQGQFSTPDALAGGPTSGMKHTLYLTQRSLDLLPAGSHQRDWELGQERMHGAI